VGPEIAAIITLVLYAPALLLLALWGQRDLAQKRRSLEIDSLLPAFKTAARRLGFRTARDRRLRGARIEGTIGSSRITAECAARGLGPWLTTISVQPQPPLPEDVWLQSHWRGNTSLVDNDAASSEPGLDTGDASFDALVAVGGRTATARVLLVEPARRLISALARKGVVRLRDGTFVHETVERVWDAGQLIALVHEVLAAQAAMPRVTDVLTSLADAARTDPVAGVRARCLATLLLEQPDQSRITAALDLALSDESDAVRVVAATALGERGIPVLREIAKREDGEEEPAARAIGLLARRLGSSEIMTILDSALRAGRRTVAFSAIESLGRGDDASACARLEALLRGDDEALAAAAANALSFTHAATAEQALVRALESPSPDVRHAAVRALGRIGRLASIAQLNTLLHGKALDPELTSAVQQAIAAIQARIPGASPGQVSLAEGEAGHVSLASDDRAGQVSLSPTEKQAP